MKRERVQSSMIASIGHNADASILEVEFTSGTIWQYYDVPKSIYKEMLNSESIGKFFRSAIKDLYTEIQIS
jgi:hypothetical protein